MGIKHNPAYELRRVPVVGRAKATRNGEFGREGCLWRLMNADVQGLREMEGGVLLACMGEE